MAWTDEGSGEFHRGFIAEDLPAVLSQGDAVAAIDIAANNTAALQEAKRRLAAVDLGIDAAAGALAEVDDSLVTYAAAVAAGDDTKRTALTGLESRLDATERDVETLREKIIREWVEIPFEQAWEEVPETQTITTAQTVTRFKYNVETMSVESYQTVADVEEEIPTGETVRRLKDGVYFDEKTGLCYIQSGAASAL